MRQVIVIRHAIAEDRDVAAREGIRDEERSLTDKGRKRMEKAARGLCRVAPQLDTIVTSPLVRAVQTAEILSRAYGKVTVRKSDLLLPGLDSEDLLAWLGHQPPRQVVALVGHEPGLSTWISWVLSGYDEGFLQLKKGAACLLEFPKRPAVAKAVVRWALTPRQLRQLGGEA